MSSDCKLYLITPPSIADVNSFSSKLIEALDACPQIAAFQLRLKDTDDDAICKIADTLIPIVTERSIAFIMNDSPELAKKTGCDGVHIGQNDKPYKQAREILGNEAIIGVTCHNSKHLAMQAGEKGASYVAFGAFYETNTKDVKTAASPDLLLWWNEMFVVPCVAIGGITPENCEPIIKAGADFIAVSSGIWEHEKGHIYAASEFSRILDTSF